MQVSIELQEAEIAQGLKRIYAHARAGKRNSLFVFVAVIVTFEIFGSIVNFMQKQDFYKSLALASEQSGGIFSFVIIFLLIYGFLTRYAPKVQYFKSDGMLRSPREIRIDQDGIHQSCRYSTSLTRWNGIRDIEEDAEFIFLYVDVVSAYMIPKRCFPSPAEAATFAAQAKGFWKVHGNGAAEAPG